MLKSQIYSIARILNYFCSSNIARMLSVLKFVPRTIRKRMTKSLRSLLSYSAECFSTTNIIGKRISFSFFIYLLIFSDKFIGLWTIYLSSGALISIPINSFANHLFQLVATLRLMASRRMLASLRHLIENCLFSILSK